MGVGLLWHVMKGVRMQAYYEFVNIEKSDNLIALNNLKSDLFTLRLQYKF